MALKLYNTRSRSKEEFEPANPPFVTMYVCGPTVYDYPHLGNWRCFVVFDVLRRYLEYVGHEVLYVQNFTDVDDKIIRRAADLGVTPQELAKLYEERYLEHARLLNVRRADFHPRATEHISEMVDLVSRLMARGHAYAVGGDVYFDTSSFPDYGKLSGQELRDLQRGARVEIDPRKEDPLDFVLWKSSKPGEPSWESPWGKGRPGWHLECSAMSVHYLGMPIDIHAGGVDLVFPHHENEIAQSEAAYGGRFVRHWLHNAFLNIGGERMGKSVGNFHTLEDLRGKMDLNAVRLFLLSAHYRNPLSFGPDEIRASEAGLDRLKNAIDALIERERSASERRVEDETSANLIAAVRRARSKFREAMDDDINTAGALAALYDLTREVNASLTLDTGRVPREAWRLALSAYKDMAGTVLGLLPQSFALEESARADASAFDQLVELILQVREDARSKKDWRLADDLRRKLSSIGLIVEDTPGGSRWKLRKADGDREV